MGRKTANLIVLTFILAAWRTYAGLEQVDGIVAIVNEDIILESEVSEQVQFLMSQMGPEAVASAGGVNVLAATVMEDMIDARLLLQQADELDIVVGKEEVGELAKENLEVFRNRFPSDAEFDAALASYGLTEKTLLKYYKKNIREQLTIKELINQEIYPNIKIEEDEVKEYYKQHKSELAVPTIVDISEVVAARAPSEETYERVRSEAIELRAKAYAGVDFGELARMYSAAANAPAGGDFSFRPGETYREIETEVAKLNPGEITEPILLPEGFWLVMLVGRDGDNYRTKTILLPVNATEDDIARARAKIEEAYAHLLKGISFDKVAREYSEEAETASAGGRVGAMELDVLAREFPEVAANIKPLIPGEYTSIIEAKDAYYIIMLNDREEGYERGFEDARDEVIDTLRTARVESELEKYVNAIKERSYIKVFNQ